MDLHIMYLHPSTAYTLWQEYYLLQHFGSLLLNTGDLKTQMHELSIALSIVDVAEKEVAKINGESVSDIELEIGKLAGIEKDALEFAWPEAIKNSVLKNANRTIVWVDAEAMCNECQKTYPIRDLFDVCPYCGSYFKEINKGKELKIKSLTIC